MRHFAALLLCFLLLPLKSCTVPDIQPFATATVEMSTALAAGYALVLDDLDGTLRLDATASQRAALQQQRAALAQRLRVNQQALAALTHYANTLVEVAEAGAKGQASLPKIATALSGVAAAFGPVAATAGGVFSAGVQLISADAQKIRTLKRLDRALNAADSAVQTATNLLAANNRDITRIDSAAASIVDAQLTEANQNVLQAYDDLLLRQAQADSVAGFLVRFELYAVDFKSARGSRRARYQVRLDSALARIGRLDEEVRPLRPFRPEQLRATLAVLAQREAFWRQRADYGISAPLQARYERVQAALAANALRARQHRQVLQKSTALAETWATSHTALRRAVTDQRHAVSFEEVVAGARQLKDYIDKLSTAFN